MSPTESSTPPRRSHRGTLPPNPLTPEQVRRKEEARLRAKAAAQAADAAKAKASPVSQIAGQKRTYSSLNPSTVPSNQRNAASQPSSALAASSTPNVPPPAGGMIQPKDPNLLKPAKNFARTEYIEYDFSRMTDTKGGFLSTDDDPHNRAMRSGQKREDEARPANMTMAEWERERLRRRLRQERQGPYEPGISVMDMITQAELEGEEEELRALGALEDAQKEDEQGQDEAGTNEKEDSEFKGQYGDGKRDLPGRCRECSSLEIDWKWADIFHISVCNACKDKHPDKYSLLTKTEAREDYLLTDPELRDKELLPHMEKPNPHKHNFHNMQLFLRLQVEHYALSKKWGSADALDAEYEKRQTVAKQRKEKKFKNKLEDLKKRTRVEAYKRARLAGAEDVGFGDRIRGAGDRHEHEWGRSVVDPTTGMSRKRCEECGMEVEELEF